MSAREQISPADSLRSPEEINAPDPRQILSLGAADEALRRHHGDVAQFVLSHAVPLDVVVQFETAKNLYLYAWHVYRFYPVAEGHALTTLEFGLRERLRSELPVILQRYKGRKKQATLPDLLRYAVDQQLIRNEGFRRWHARARLRAEERYRLERIKKMAAEGLEQIELDYENAVIEPVDQNLNLVDELVDSLRENRNMHAHGGRYLAPRGLGTFELVTEILNQVFEA